MPKYVIALPYQVAHLSILDAEGHAEGCDDPVIPSSSPNFNALSDGGEAAVV